MAGFGDALKGAIANSSKLKDSLKSVGSSVSEKINEASSVNETNNNINISNNPSNGNSLRSSLQNTIQKNLQKINFNKSPSQSEPPKPPRSTPTQPRKEPESGDTRIALIFGIILGLLVALSIFAIFKQSYFWSVGLFCAAIIIFGIVEAVVSKSRGRESKVLKILVPGIKQAKNNPGQAFLIILVLLMLLSGLFFFSPLSLIKSTGEYVRDTFNIENINLLASKLVAKSFKFFGYVNDQYNERIAIATGQQDLFESQVDTAQNLGVEVEFDNQRNEYYYPEKAYLFGTLTGRSLDPAVCDAIGKTCSDGNVVITCRTKEGVVPINNEQSISLSFDQIEGLSASFQCQVPAYTNENSSTQIAQVNVIYPFRTAGYARVPFLREEVYQRLESANEKVQTYTPQFTPGPVKISFSKLSDPITIREGTGFVNTKSFSFEIENTGQGVIEDFTSITFSVPQGFEGITCNTDPAEPSCSGETCNLKNEEGTDFLDRFSNLANGKKIIVTCQAIVSPSVLEASSEITYDSFKVLAEYNYRSFDTFNIKRKQPDYAVELACNEKCTSSFGCTCPTSCSPGSRYISSGQTCAVLN